MTKRLNYFIGMAAIALAVILIVLTIACFAVLTYVSADSEYKLSEKSLASVNGYYQADSSAHETLQKISSIIKNKKNLQDFAAKKGYNVTRAAGKDYISFQIPISDTKILEVEAVFSSPEDFEIQRWETIFQAEKD